jgi:hypothetical protein
MLGLHTDRSQKLEGAGGHWTRPPNGRDGGRGDQTGDDQPAQHRKPWSNTLPFASPRESPFGESSQASE